MPSTTAGLGLAPGTYDSSAILVCVREDGAQTLPPAVEGAAATSAKALGGGLFQVQLADSVSVETALQAYRANPTVLYAEPDYRVQIQIVPDDPSLSQLWGLHNTGQTGGTTDADIDAPEAWAFSTGSLQVDVGIIDTGIDYTHPDLYLNIWINQAEIPTAIKNALVDADSDGLITFWDLNAAANAGKVTDWNSTGFIDGGDLLDDRSGWEDGADSGSDTNSYRDDLIGWDFINEDNDPRDDHDHGTHVAGTIGAIGDNGVGVSGVNWQVRMAGLKFLGANGSGSLGDAVEAVNYAVGVQLDLTSNSWGGGGYSQALYDAIAAANAAGQLFVAAAGNAGSNNDITAAYPAGYDLPNVISVAATDHNDALASFSNYGAATVDLGAPGVAIVSTTRNNSYSSFSGTSMATPHVSGVAALIIGQHPQWSAQQVIAQILGATDTVNSLTGKTVTGGRLNAAAAIGPDTRGPRITGLSPSSSADPVSSLVVTFSEPVSAGTFTTDDVISFSGPGGAIAVSGVEAVAGSGNRQFRISFAEQSVLGEYTIVIGPQIADVSGNLMNQNGVAGNGEVPGDRYTGTFAIVDELVFASSDVPAPIQDWAAVISYLTIDQDVTIAGLKVQLDITHTWDEDIQFYLVAPGGDILAGEYVMLSAFHGGSGDNYRGTIFDDTAPLSITQGSAPFSGTYRPEEPLSYFTGMNAQGTWQLVVEDWGFGDQGTLNAWSLMIQPVETTTPPPPPPSNNPPNAVDDPAPQTQEDVSVTIAVLANDSDPDNDPVSVTGVSNVQHGTAVVNADNTIRFTPAGNFSGSASFTYTIGDGKGGTDSALVTIAVAPVNDAPVAVDDVVTAARGTPLRFDGLAGNPQSPSGNDIDVDGDTLQITSVGAAVHGAVVLNGSTVVFTPEPGYIGPASFEYTISDGKGGSDTGKVNITVKDYYYLSTTANGTLTNSDGSSLSVGDEDILLLTVENGAYRYELFLDGSDVGLTTTNEDIDAFAFLSDGSIVVSTLGSFSVPGPGGTTISGAGEDLLRFVPTSLGATTAGTWSLYFDGSDVGLSGNSENVDGAAVLGDGRILISTAGSVSVPGASGADTDLLAFAPNTLGSNTSGQWAVYFDGSDVSLSDGGAEDIDSLFVAPATSGNPTLYFSTRGNFSVPRPTPPGGSLSGENEDIFAFNPTSLGAATAGTYGTALAFDGSLYGLASSDLDGFHIGPRPTSASSTVSVTGEQLGSASAGANSLAAGVTGRSQPSTAVLDLFFASLYKRKRAELWL